MKTIFKYNKIALVGPSYTGKTTIAADFAQRHIDQFEAVSIQTADRLGKYGFDSHAQMLGSNTRESIEFARKFQSDLAEDRHELYCQINKPVIVDRSAIDAWVYHYSAFASRDSSENLKILEDRSVELMREFDLIVRIPYPCLPMESGQVRRFNSFEYHRLTDQCYSMFLDSNAQRLPGVTKMPMEVATGSRGMRISWLTSITRESDWDVVNGTWKR